MKYHYLTNITLMAAALYASVTNAITYTFDHHYIKANTAIIDAHDWAGYSVAIDGDIMVVGAQYEDSSATGIHTSPFTAAQDDSAANAGAAYVFERNASGNWVMTAYLKADNTDATDYFGHAVAVSGNTIVVTAIGEDSNQETVGNNGLLFYHTPSSDNSRSFAGAAYVFIRNPITGEWTQQAYLKVPSPSGSGSGLGRSAAIDSNRIVLGAFDGRVHVFNRTSSSLGSPIPITYYSWSREPSPLTPIAVSSGRDSFGHAVDIDGDTIVVGDLDDASDGSSSSDTSRPNSGAAYVFYYNGSSWQRQAYLKADNPDILDGFGASVAIDGDMLAVGAPDEDSSGVSADDNSLQNAGAVYLFKRSGSGATATWALNTPMHYIKAPNANSYDAFGVAVDMDNGELAVGAIGEDGNGNSQHQNYGGTAISQSGAVYVFAPRPGGTWSQVAYLKSSYPDRGDFFGFSVAIDDSNVAVGTAFEDSNGSNGENNNLKNAGAAYLYISTGMIGVPIGPGIKFTIGGNVSGLPENSHIVLQNQHADGYTSTTTAYANDRRFSFADKVSSTYNVTVVPSSLPPGVHCNVINGAGDVTGVGDIFNIWVLCTGSIFRDSFE